MKRTTTWSTSVVFPKQVRINAMQRLEKVKANIPKNPDDSAPKAVVMHQDIGSAAIWGGMFSKTINFATQGQSPLCATSVIGVYSQDGDICVVTIDQPVNKPSEIQYAGVVFYDMRMIRELNNCKVESPMIYMPMPGQHCKSVKFLGVCEGVACFAFVPDMEYLRTNAQSPDLKAIMERIDAFEEVIAEANL